MLTKDLPEDLSLEDRLKVLLTHENATVVGNCKIYLRKLVEADTEEKCIGCCFIVYFRHWRNHAVVEYG